MLNCYADPKRAAEDRSRRAMVANLHFEEREHMINDYSYFVEHP